MYRRLTLTLAMMASLTACAAEPPAKPATALAASSSAPAALPAAPGEAAVRAAIAKILPTMSVSSVAPAPFPGFSEVAVQGRVFYVSNDGKYLMHGNLLDVARNENLTRVSEGVLRRDDLAKVGPDRRIIFAAADPKFRVTVFTDVDCGFCRKLHEQMAAYNRAGITIEYLFYPRSGPGSESFEQAVAIWCSADRRAALTRAKAGTLLPHATCKNPVAADYALGRRIGVDGTPAIYAENGVQIGGYASPDELLVRLEEVKAGRF